MSIIPEPTAPTTSHSAPRASHTEGEPSAWRAWCYLVVLSWQRQARARQMVWIAIGLLAFTAAVVAVNTAGNRWDMHNWRWTGPSLGTAHLETYQRRTLGKAVDESEMMLALLPRPQGVPALDISAAQAAQAVLNESAFLVFTQNFIFNVFLPFLLPLLSLSFATEALGGDREANSLVWLLTRPLSRSAIYLAKFVALLPWSLCLNVGGFALLCLLAGWQGKEALRLFWPAVVWATLAFSALFYLMGAFFRRPAIVALVYAFFLETILGSMPGYLKRVSINFYAKCMMYEAAESYSIKPERPNVFLAVDSTTALATLVTVTVLLVAIGTVIFARIQYQDAV